MSLALVRLGFAGLMFTMCLLLTLCGRSLEPLGYVTVGASLAIAFNLAFPALVVMLRRLRAGEWPGEETLRGRVELTHAVTPRDRWLGAQRLLHAHFGGDVVAEDVSRLDALAAEGWRVSSTEPINALHLRREGEHRIVVPGAWIHGARVSSGATSEEQPRASKVALGSTIQPRSASLVSAPEPVPFGEGDPWYSSDVLKFVAARNTFTLFQQHGRIDLDWRRNDAQRTAPISREDCVSMLKTMQAWTSQKTSAAEAAALGTDLDYVQHDIAHITEVLACQHYQHCHSVMWEAFHDHNRERDEDERRADDYCHRLYSGPVDE